MGHQQSALGEEGLTGPQLSEACTASWVFSYCVAAVAADAADAGCTEFVCALPVPLAREAIQDAVRRDVHTMQQRYPAIKMVKADLVDFNVSAADRQRQ